MLLLLMQSLMSSSYYRATGFAHNNNTTEEKKLHHSCFLQCRFSPVCVDPRSSSSSPIISGNWPFTPSAAAAAVSAACVYSGRCPSYATRLGTFQQLPIRVCVVWRDMPKKSAKTTVEEGHTEGLAYAKKCTLLLLLQLHF